MTPRTVRRPEDLGPVVPLRMLVELLGEVTGRVFAEQAAGGVLDVDDVLTVLAVRTRIGQEMTRPRWCWVRDALRAGATLPQIAEALAIAADADRAVEEVRHGYHAWVQGQVQLYSLQGRQPGLSPAEAADALALLGTADDQHRQAPGRAS